jgi:diguanylate cyclase (GGDEF)-like protein
MKSRLFDPETLKQAHVDSLISAAVAIPIFVNGRVLGALCLTKSQHYAEFPAHLRFLESSVEVLSQTLRRVLDEATIRRQARHDHLTDLVNRRSFDAYLATEIERIEHRESPACSLILADLDHFKSVNDRYGHPSGDHVLRSAARVLSEQVARLRLGEHSIVARYGGEEFAILLPNVGLAGAARVAEGIRHAVEAQAIPVQNEKIHVTISLGVASVPLHAKSADSLVCAADRALYRAKSKGRNCVCQAEITDQKLPSAGRALDACQLRIVQPDKTAVMA